MTPPLLSLLEGIPASDNYIYGLRYSEKGFVCRYYLPTSMTYLSG
jgi:hypothetical protein